MASKKIKTLRSKALIIHPDTDTVMRDQEARYQAALKTQAELSQIFKRFEEFDKPNFAKWMQSHFELEFIEFEQKLEELTDIKEQMDAIDYYAEVKGTTLRAAAKVIFAARDKSKEVFHEFMDELAALHENDDDDHDDDYYCDCPNCQSVFDKDDFESEDDFEDSFADIFSSRANQETFDGFSSSKSMSFVQDSEFDPGLDYFKNIYHACVRLTHPDQVGSKDFDSDLWQQLQTAYKCEDYQKLELLHERILLAHPCKKSLTAGALCDIRLHVQDKIVDIKHEISCAKFERSWAFTEKSEDPKHLKKLSKKVSSDLNEDLETLVLQIKYAKMHLDDLRPKTSRPR
ncbi:MAG: hypothetical protein EOP04_17420, partial [Proteobacteria bacterium]